VVTGNHRPMNIGWNC